MEEFFDFAALEHDYQVGATEPCHQERHIPFRSANDLTSMQWAMNPTVAIRPVETVPAWDVPMYDAPPHAPIDQVDQQWPLFDVSNRSAPANMNPMSDSALLAGDPIPVEEPSSAHAPSSSLINTFHSDLNYAESSGVANLPQLESPPSQEERPIVPVGDSLPMPALPTSPVSSSQQTLNVSWKPASAKRKGAQGRIPVEAKQILEEEFAANSYPCSWELDIIAHQANLEVKKVRNWFNNTRARKKYEGEYLTIHTILLLLTWLDLHPEAQSESTPSGRVLKPRLSKDSLDSLDKQADDAKSPPQPPLAVYLAQSYQEESAELSAVQAAIDNHSLSGSCQDDAWSGSKQGRRGSVITSIASSEGTAPTSYTVSSGGSRSNISSFGRDRRRGRRRMAWKESPRQAINGVNSAGEPQQDLPFFCTFCPRAFKTKYEWIRHEDSVHALRTTWICCDLKASAVLQACPFCGQAHPDDAHMAGHRYQQCRSKPEAQRTFYRRDHFIQHLHHVHFGNSKHPSVRVGCQALLLAAEGHNFGCKDLTMKWRRFGAPMKLDDPMLHCGFCGKKSKDWSERCEHVAEHLVARELNRAVWWNERKENHLENLYSTSPYESFRCRYCQKVFTDVKQMNEHSHCRVWSCRFLRSFDDVAADNAAPPLGTDFPSAKAHHCHLCSAGYRTFHVEHAKHQHRYRSCNQEFYTSEDAFLQHLHNFHGASQPALLRDNGVIEQSFMRNKGASFEPVEFNESWQPCVMDLDVASVSPFIADNALLALVGNPKKSRAHTRKPLSMPKKPRDIAQPSSQATQKAQRQRSDTAASKAESNNPRFFRLDVHIPFLSSRIFYSRHSKASSLPKNNQAVLEEMPKPHVTTLLMSAGLVGMASARCAVRPERDTASGLVELVLDGEMLQ
ncbi:c2h2 type zinc finger domain-containing protein [Stemphylium lycopersici]|uniref:C2h2 type zinc finger domain-containing protein n=1 Tax=Stemphylium lycopersici TaxID=183478 RepID=A0A364NFI8_STELY|nr:c2h2 type zinc finger domain-containing protein [Stemphylium lycopersici]